MTICEKCGGAREFIPDACPSCGFRPESTRELATAALLTTLFPAGPDEFGTLQAQLDELASAIRRGDSIHLSEVELQRHELAIENFLAVKPAGVAWSLLRLFLPGILFLTALVSLWMLLRLLNA